MRMPRLRLLSSRSPAGDVGGDEESGNCGALGGGDTGRTDEGIDMEHLAVGGGHCL
jgi:hypothetical protein